MIVVTLNILTLKSNINCRSRVNIDIISSIFLVLQAIPIGTFVGYWVQLSNDREIMCSQAAYSVIKCLWTDNSGILVSQNITIQGISLSFASITGNYSGNGVITWTDGSTWTKQGETNFDTQSKYKIIEKIATRLK